VINQSISISSECTVQCRFFESRLLEAPFRPRRCAVSTRGIKFSRNAYLHVHTRLYYVSVVFCVFSCVLDKIKGLISVHCSVLYCIFLIQLLYYCIY
jgi:hypothetical protein